VAQRLRTQFAAGGAKSPRRLAHELRDRVAALQDRVAFAIAERRQRREIRAPRGDLVAGVAQRA
jgi:hypothetical protein